MFLGPGRLRWEEVPAPLLIEPGDALVAPIASTTCDLDRFLVQGRTPFTGPFAIGHECVAEVLELGDDVVGFSVGDVVVVSWHVACGTCSQCARGLPAACRGVPRFAQYGLPVAGDWGGTFADRVRVPFASYNLVRVPDGVDAATVASAGDNLSLGWEVVAPWLEGIDDPRVVVFGGTGSVGLYAADVARNAVGAETVYVDPDPDRLSVAASLGIDTLEAPSRRLRDFDLAIDASGNPTWLRAALRSVVPEGQVNSVGIYFEDVPLPLFELYVRGVNFHNGKGHARSHIPAALEAVAAGILTPQAISSGIHDFADAPEVIASGAHKPVFVRSRTTTTPHRTGSSR
jgi:alcohol dehydrogenase